MRRLVPSSGNYPMPAIRFSRVNRCRSAGALALLLALLLTSGCGRRNAGQPRAGKNIRQIGIAGQQSGIRINLRHGTDRGDRIEVAGLDTDEVSRATAVFKQPQWRRFLAVSVASTPGNEPPPMLGSYSIEDGLLVFEPEFPFEPGLGYRAVLDPSVLDGMTTGRVHSLEFSIPKPDPGPPTVVTRVHPTGDTLPENLLKFYIHFSAPMSRGEVYERVHLLDGRGNEVDYPFLKLGEELWDHSGTRITLLIDPGRIKRGLKPREDVGPVLEAGGNYTLMIDREWLDADSRQLAETHRKSFKAAKADAVQPDPANWKLAVPAAGASDPLAVSFPEPLDHAMLERVLGVQDDRGRVVEGSIEIDRGDTRWQFVPRQDWQAGGYRLIIVTTLEDLAGNSIERPFEVDVQRKIEREVRTKTVSRAFEVPASR